MVANGILATAAVAAHLSALAAGTPRWTTGEPIPVWIEDTRVPSDHVERVRRAFAAWSAASGGLLTFGETPEFPSGGIRVRFARGQPNFGEAAPSVDRPTGRIVAAEVVVSLDVPGDRLQRKLVAYLTLLHEIGHALGLPHTDDFNTIMYRFRRPPDPARYFRRYRRRLGSERDVGSQHASGLSPADAAALRQLYGWRRR